MSQIPPPPRIRAIWGQWIRELEDGANRAFLEVPFRPTSWYRDEARNKLAGGAEFSQHRVGTAFDAKPAPGFTNACLVEALRRTNRFHTVLDRGSHVHAQVLPAGLVRDVVRTRPDWI